MSTRLLLFLCVLFTLTSIYQPATTDDINKRYMKFKKDYLNTFLQPRIPGTEGNKVVREFIIRTLKEKDYEVLEDKFTATTPHKDVEFVNIFATFNPYARERITFACHYDSKSMPHEEVPFIGASDSAVPCAMLLEMGVSLEPLMKRDSQKTLQLIFFDGEEAFENWSATDSLYGSRHLADTMSKSLLNVPYHGETPTLLNRINVLVLLDLLADCRPSLNNYFHNTKTYFEELVEIEKMLMQNNFLSKNAASGYFYNVETDTYTNKYHFGIQDDHLPFLHRNVPILHVIPHPFPWYWHTVQDDESVICPDMVIDLLEIFTYFIRYQLDLIS